MVDVTASFSGSIPEYYDAILGPAQFEGYAKDLVRRLPANVPGGVLETACGTGIVTRELRKHLDKEVRLVATDLNLAMIEHARRRVAGAIEWREADACKLPFPDRSFGAVVCAFGVMFMPDKKAAFAEARRVLSPGGKLVFNVWDRLEHNPQSVASSAVVAALFPNDPLADFARVPYGFNDQAVIRGLLGEAGFGAMRFETVKLPVESPSALDLATGVVRGTPRGLLLQQRGASLDDVIARIAAELARVGGEKPFRSTKQAIVVEAHVPA